MKFRAEDESNEFRAHDEAAIEIVSLVEGIYYSCLLTRCKL